MSFKWDDLDPGLYAFLAKSGYMRALRAERSDPYEALAEIWFGKQRYEDPQCREFMVDAVLGAWRNGKPNSLFDLIAGPCYGLLCKDRLWEIGGDHET